ncbi:hypothetical protein RE432_15080 [Pusillimonas sp. SM2304]|uniref:hypothetical protein n=1 Tax=Pusillimonas sp. SM2304 TaxID=3073241 RepID=UPI0028761D94|nr:hypothetical protein [Pusillimonas sp. SM2304]MDS1141763.1 hypothetical protein [Pusillimonas sp. SM2304]
MKKAETEDTNKGDMGDFGFWIFIVVLMVLFAGEPNLHDKLIKRLDCPISVQEQGGSNHDNQ